MTNIALEVSKSDAEFGFFFVKGENFFEEHSDA